MVEEEMSTTCSTIFVQILKDPRNTFLVLVLFDDPMGKEMYHKDIADTNISLAKNSTF